MVNNFNAHSRTAWGQRFITGPDGLNATTTHEATIYRRDVDPTDTNGRSQAPRQLRVSDVTSDRARLSWQYQPGNTWMTTYEVVAVSGVTETRIVTANRSMVTLTDLKGATEYKFAVYARNLIGQRSPRSAFVIAVTPPAR
jgi:hypothetical protein